MFSVVAVELLPDIVKGHAPLEVALGFGMGVAAMPGVRARTQKMEAASPNAAAQALPLGLLPGFAALFLCGAGLGATLLHNLSGNVLEVVLSFGLAALLFLFTEELLTEAHEEEETPLLTLAVLRRFSAVPFVGNGSVNACKKEGGDSNGNE